MQNPIILDGATGTMLQNMGMPTGVCTEQWILEHPKVLQEIQSGYVAAGSQVVYAPTFGANRIKLAQHGLGDRVAEYNRRLVEVSRQAVGDKARVAGNLSPTGQFIAPMGDMTFEELVSVYTEQAEALEEAGVDLFVIETSMTLPEARAALLAVRSVSSKPVYVTFSVDDHGRTLTGTDALAALVTMEAMGASAFGLNCSSGPQEMLNQFQRLCTHTSISLIAKPNAGMPEIVDGATIYSCSPEEFVSYTPQLAQCGVRIFGGCCGTTPAHISALCGAVDTLPEELEPLDAPFELAVATEKEAFFLEDVDPEDCVDIECSEDLLDDLMDGTEEDETFFRLSLSGQEDLDTFAECQYAVQKPLILVTDNAADLETALRLYQGVALYQDNGSIPAETLSRFAGKYGLRVI